MLTIIEYENVRDVNAALDGLRHPGSCTAGPSRARRGRRGLWRPRRSWVRRCWAAVLRARGRCWPGWHPEKRSRRRRHPRWTLRKIRLRPARPRRVKHPQLPILRLSPIRPRSCRRAPPPEGHSRTPERSTVSYSGSVRFRAPHRVRKVASHPLRAPHHARRADSHRHPGSLRAGRADPLLDWGWLHAPMAAYRRYPGSHRARRVAVLRHPESHHARRAAADRATRTRSGRAPLWRTPPGKPPERPRTAVPYSQIESPSKNLAATQHPSPPTLSDQGPVQPLQRNISALKLSGNN